MICVRSQSRSSIGGSWANVCSSFTSVSVAIVQEGALERLQFALVQLHRPRGAPVDCDRRRQPRRAEQRRRYLRDRLLALLDLAGRVCGEEGVGLKVGLDLAVNVGTEGEVLVLVLSLDEGLLLHWRLQCWRRSDCAILGDDVSLDLRPRSKK